jgi:hypothetical protein
MHPAFPTWRKKRGSHRALLGGVRSHRGGDRRCRPRELATGWSLRACPLNARWLLVHMIIKTAWHLGHLDLLRRGLGCATGVELRAPSVPSKTRLPPPATRRRTAHRGPAAGRPAESSRQWPPRSRPITRTHRSGGVVPRRLPGNGTTAAHGKRRRTEARPPRAADQKSEGLACQGLGGR